MLGSRRRDLSGWRDYWLSEARLRAFDAAKVLAMDLVISASSISRRDWLLNRANGKVLHRAAMDSWCRRYPLAWRATAVGELSMILGGAVPSVDAGFQPNSDTSYLDHVVCGTSTYSRRNLEMAQFALFGNADGRGAVSPPCILADWDKFILHCHERSLQEDIVQHEYSIRNS